MDNKNAGDDAMMVVGMPEMVAGVDGIMKAFNAMMMARKAGNKEAAKVAKKVWEAVKEDEMNSWN